MAVEGGGRADKLGNRYEGLWVARQMLFVLANELASVQIEAIGDDEEGVDLWIMNRDGLRHAFQCKRKNKRKGVWSVADLNSRGVLNHIAGQLQRDATVQFTFVSSDRAPDLTSLCELARSSDDKPEGFFQAVQREPGLLEPFQRFCTALRWDSTQAQDRAAAYQFLQRIRSHVFDDSAESRRDVEMHARYLVTGAPPLVVQTLTAFAQDNLGNTLHVDQIRRHLSDSGFGLRDLAGQPDLAARFERLQVEFRESLEPHLIGGNTIPREETKKLLEAIEATPLRQLIVLHGLGGSGKSGVLLELVQSLTTRGIPFLPLRLDRRPTKVSAARYGKDVCDLPDSPALSLRAVAGDRLAVLLIDQLDAIRWTAVHGAAAWDACQEVIDEALQFPNLRVIVACRSFDLRDDQQIKGWHTRRQGSEVEVQPLSEATVAEVVQQLGGEPQRLTARQKLLLTSPHCLALWAELRRERQPPSFETAADLMRLFWVSRWQKLTEMGVADESRTLVNKLVTWMDQQGKPSAPTRLLDSHPQGANALQSLYVFSRTGTLVNFAHQSYFEYLLASQLSDEVMQGQRPVVTWLKDNDQSLFRREQLRLLLAILREDSPEQYYAAATDLLADADIRFHLKHLVLTFMGDCRDPREEEVQLVLRLVKDDFWREHVYLMLQGRAPWFAALDDRGVYQGWLTSDDVDQARQAVWHLFRVSETCGERIASLLAPFRGKPDPWPVWIANALPISGEADVRGIFELRLWAIREGVQLRHWLFPAKLLEREPVWCVELLEAALQRQLSLASRPLPGRDTRADEPVGIHISTREILPRLAALASEEMWRRLTPLVIEACHNCCEQSWSRGYNLYQVDSFWVRPTVGHRMVERPDLLVALAQAGGNLARRQQAAFFEVNAGLSTSRFLTIQRLWTQVLMFCEYEAADRALCWLCEEPARLSLGEWGEHRWELACQLIRRFALFCSEAIYSRLEQLLLGYHDPYEFQNLLYVYGNCERVLSQPPDWYGLAQLALLPALPAARRSKSVEVLMRELREKFRTSAEDFLGTRFNFVHSQVPPIPPDELPNVTNERWLQIIAEYSDNLRNLRTREVDSRHFTVDNAQSYAHEMGLQAQREPGRFARLIPQIPAQANPAYVTSLLYAIAQNNPPNQDQKTGWQPATAPEMAAVALHVGYQTNRDVALGLCRLIQQRFDANWPESVLSLLARYATEHPDPAPEALQEDPVGDQDLERLSINCVRGVAVHALQVGLFALSEQIETFLTVIRQVVQDPSPIVRTAAARLCLPLLNWNRDVAVEVFLQNSETIDRVLACRDVGLFFSYACSTHKAQLQPLIRRMAESDNDETACQGAQWLTANWLHTRDDEDHVLRCAQGKSAERKGVASVASNSLDDIALRPGCLQLLPLFFEDADPEVRGETHSFLRAKNVLQDGAVVHMTQGYAASQSFLDEPTDLVEALRNHSGSLVPLAGLAFTVCDQFSGRLAPQTRSIAEGHGFEATYLSPLLLRLYEQAEQQHERDIQKRCLDCWDDLLRARVGFRDLWEGL